MIQEEVVVKVINALEGLKIPYMLTGAMAVNFYGKLRLTYDIDIVVQIQKQDAAKLVKVLAPNFLISKKDILQAMKEKGMVNALHLKSGLKIDFWILKEEKYDQRRFSRRLRKRIFGRKICLISPEDLIITKLVWFKKSKIEKHFQDAKGIWEVSEKHLDVPCLKKWAKYRRVASLLQKTLISSNVPIKDDRLV